MLDFQGVILLYVVIYLYIEVYNFGGSLFGVRNIMDALLNLSSHVGEVHLSLIGEVYLLLERAIQL